MFTRFIVVAGLAALSCGVASAGTINNGAWKPSTCGDVPGDAPTIKSRDVDSYNASIKEATKYQEKVQLYANCLANEANTDQKTIVTSANDLSKSLSDNMTKLQDDTNKATAALKRNQNRGGN